MVLGCGYGKNVNHQRSKLRAVRSERLEPGGWGAFPTIAEDPSNPGSMVAGADVGGLFASNDGGASWSECGHDLRTLFILDLRFIPPDHGWSDSLLLVGTSLGVYMGVPTETSHDTTSPPCAAWNFSLQNNGFLDVNSTVSMQQDGEMFSHPIGALHYDPGLKKIFAVVSVNKARGPAKPRAGDPYVVYMTNFPGQSTERNTTSNLTVAPLLWTGVLAYASPINVFSVAATTRALYVATDQGLFVTSTTQTTFGARWVELGVSPAMVSLNGGRNWQTCDKTTCPGIPSSPCNAFPAPPSVLGLKEPRCLPITTQANRTHPNVRTVSVSNGSVFVTVWEEGWYPNCTSLSHVDPTLEWFRGGPFVSHDYGRSFSWLFAVHSFKNASLRCAMQSSKYSTGNFPLLAVDPSNSGHVLLAGWGSSSQGLYELKNASWTQWGLCNAADPNNVIEIADCFEGGRIDTMALDTNQYAYDFRVSNWESNRTVSVVRGLPSPVVVTAGISRPTILITDSRGAFRGLWDSNHSRYGFLHLNDKYVHVDPATRLPLWRTTGLGDTCVNAAVVLPSGTILLAVADGGVARTVDNGSTWTRPAELWPNELARTSQGEALIYDGLSKCAFISHYNRGGNEAGTVLSSCLDGVSWVVVGGWNGDANNSSGINGLNITGSMRQQLVFDFDSSASQQGLIVSSEKGHVFRGRPAQGGVYQWTEIPVPIVCPAGGQRASTAINMLYTTQLAPSLLFMARADGLWITRTPLNVDGDYNWERIAPNLYNPTSLLALSNSNSLTSNGTVTLMVGAGSSTYGTNATIFRGVIDSSTGMELQNFDATYELTGNSSNKTPAEIAALEKMQISAFTTPNKTPGPIFVGLRAGDYFDLYSPPYILESTNRGESFVPSAVSAFISNANVAGLSVLDDDAVCVSTNGNGLQCVWWQTL